MAAWPHATAVAAGPQIVDRAASASQPLQPTQAADTSTSAGEPSSPTLPPPQHRPQASPAHQPVATAAASAAVTPRLVLQRRPSSQSSSSASEQSDADGDAESGPLHLAAEGLGSQPTSPPATEFSHHIAAADSFPTATKTMPSAAGHNRHENSQQRPSAARDVPQKADGDDGEPPTRPVHRLWASSQFSAQELQKASLAQLLNMRSALAMELVWLQQAIALRQQVGSSMIHYPG